MVNKILLPCLEYLVKLLHMPPHLLILCKVLMGQWLTKKTLNIMATLNTMATIRVILERTQKSSQYGTLQHTNVLCYC